jgi:ribonucleoside-diphosphate reductase alpha chain
MARSVVDYLARWMASRFLSEEDQRIAGVLPLAEPAAPAQEEAEVADDQLAFREVAAPAEGSDANGTRSKLVLQSTGQTCTSCGSSDLVRSGTCLTCRTCGATSGCG